MNRMLVAVRHGQSEWNAQHRFTGWRDPDLTAQGVAEAHGVGRKLKSQGLQFDFAFASTLRRSRQSLEIILRELEQSGVPINADPALKERDYGDLSGMNKEEACRRWGEEQVHLWRRSYDIPPPGGESLKDTVARVLPFYNQEILPLILRGNRILLVAHGNSLRALAMVLDRLAPDAVTALQIKTGMIMTYCLHTDSTVASKHFFLGDGDASDEVL